MFFYLYQLLFLLLFLPYLAIRYFQKKKTDLHLKYRLGFGIETDHSKKVIWIHAVSLGEIKAAKPVFDGLKKRFSKCNFVITTTTKTGKEEAEKTMAFAKYGFLPFDLSFCIRKFLKNVKPDVALFMEGDLWPNLFRHLNKKNCPILLLNAQMSKRSLRRFQAFPYLAKKIFSPIDTIFSQSAADKKNFESFGAKKVLISGNIKLANAPRDISSKRADYKISAKQTVLVLGSTHNGEEELLLRQITKWDRRDLVIFVAPRHPERFLKVGALLQQMGLSFCRLTDLKERKRVEGIILVDQMGKLMDIYSISNFAIVGGSFVKGVGGHNILEPIFAKAAVGFGPYMDAQLNLKQVALAYKAAAEIELLSLESSLKKYIFDLQLQKQMVKQGEDLLHSFKGMLDPVFKSIEKKLSS